MLKKIKIKNFQSHERTALNLSPGVNVIVGRSTTGKSAIVRAFRWLMLNRPAGDAFKSNFADADDSVKVEVITREGARIIAEKLKRPNGHSYQVGNDGRNYDFEGVGRAVPDMATTALNMKGINVQTQLEPHFLIASTPSAFSAAIHKITNAAKVENAIARMLRHINTLKNSLRSNKAELERVNTELETFSDFEQLQQYYAKAAAHNNAVRDYARTRQKFCDIRQRIVKYRSSIAPKSTMRTLHDIIDHAARWHFEELNASTCITKIDELRSRIRDLRVLNKILHDYRVCIKEVSISGRTIQQCERVLHKTQLLYEARNRAFRAKEKAKLLHRDIQIELNTMNECPTCGRSMDENCVH